MENWITIRNMKATGLSIKQISRELGISRNTVRKALKGIDPPRYQRIISKEKPYDAFEKEIAEMMAKGLIGSRIFEELKKLGYSGSKTRFYIHLKKLKGDDTFMEKVTERFETAPGFQAQFDWSPYTVEVGGYLHKLILYGYTLCYSRRKHYFASYNESLSSCLEALEDSFITYGGAAKEILVDNAKVFVVNASVGNFRWNPHFMEFCGYYRTAPRACRVRRAQTKGKVERPFFYLQEHFIKGNSFRDFGHFNEELKTFELRLDEMVHSTTRQKPIERFQEEIPCLIPLPENRFIGSKVEWRKVSWDCLLSYNGVRYSVPWQYAGKQVCIKVSRGMMLEIYNQKAILIAQHAISTQKGMTIMNKEHYEGLRKRIPRTKAMLEKQFMDLFPEERMFFDALIAQQKHNPIYHLQAIIEMAELYPREAIHKAIVLAKQYNTYSFTFIKGILQQTQPKEMPTTIGGVLIPQINITRDLQEYSIEFDGGEHDRN